jgi:hypothetical protein
VLDHSGSEVWIASAGETGFVVQCQDDAMATSGFHGCFCTKDIEWGIRRSSNIQLWTLSIPFQGEENPQ